MSLAHLTLDDIGLVALLFLAATLVAVGGTRWLERARAERRR
jgi:hypothetical protein